MSWIRTGIFISLTLVASTLPANAVSAPLIPSAPADAAARPASPQNEPGSNSPEQSAPKKNPVDSGPVMQAACQMDVVKTATTRPHGNNGPQLIAGIIERLLTAWKPSPAIGQDLLSHAVRVPEHAHEWLTCRYPHAPPALA